MNSNFNYKSIVVKFISLNEWLNIIILWIIKHIYHENVRINYERNFNINEYDFLNDHMFIYIIMMFVLNN